MTILKALAMILVVLGHVDSHKFSWFPPYSFHLTIFFFVSGYFYKEIYEKDMFLFARKKFNSLVVPYFLYNFCYAVLTFLLRTRLNIVVDATENFNLKSFFIMPFINGHQYMLYLAAWFVLQLFVIQLVFLAVHSILKKLITSKEFHLMFFLLVALLATYLAKEGYNKSSLGIITIRTLFGMFFFYLGFYYKLVLEKTNIFKVQILLPLFVIQIILLRINNGDLNYGFVWAYYNNLVFTPIVTGVNGIYLYLFISRAISKVLPSNDILLSIGKNTFHIMANHLLVFFLINTLIVWKSSVVTKEVLNNVWYIHNPDKYWLLYVGLGVLIPTYISKFIKSLLKKPIDSDQLVNQGVQ